MIASICPSGVGAATILLLLVSSGESAEECVAPCVAYTISAELQADRIFDSRWGVDNSSNIGPAIDAEFTIAPADHLKIIAGIATEPVLDPVPSEDRTFGDIGTYVNKLYAEADYDPVTIRGGKFEPEFGLAAQRLDGVYASDLVSDYDNEERWGVEGMVQFDALGLSHSLIASAFTTDRTVFSESLFTNRGRRRLSDGGAGNAEGIASFAAVFEGCKGAETPDCFMDGSFGYRFGVRHQRAGQPTQEQIDEEITPRAETGYLTAATTRFDAGEVVVRLLGEVAYFQHFEGAPDNVLFATAGASIEWEPMTFMGTYTRKRNMIADEPDTTDHLFDLTAAYKFGEDRSIAGEKWTLAAGYRYRRNDSGEADHTIGMKLTMDLEGAVGGEATEPPE